MSTFINVVGGVFVYAISKMILDRILEQMKMTRKIEFNLNYYKNVYSVFKGEDRRYVEAAKIFRKFGALLLSTTSGIPCIIYYPFEKLHFLISKDNIKEASRALLSLSNGNMSLLDKDGIGHNNEQTVADNIEDSRRIGRLLNINLWP